MSHRGDRFEWRGPAVDGRGRPVAWLLVNRRHVAKVTMFGSWGDGTAVFVGEVPGVWWQSFGPDHRRAVHETEEAYRNHRWPASS